MHIDSIDHLVVTVRDLRAAIAATAAGFDT